MFIPDINMSGQLGAPVCDDVQVKDRVEVALLVGGVALPVAEYEQILQTLQYISQSFYAALFPNINVPRRPTSF